MPALLQGSLDWTEPLGERRVEQPGSDLNRSTSEDTTITFSKAGYIAQFRLLYAVWSKNV